MAYELHDQNYKAVKAFEEYLQRYAKLGVPLGDRQREIRTRKALLENLASDKAISKEGIAKAVVDLINVRPVGRQEKIQLGLVLGPTLRKEHLEVFKELQAAIKGDNAGIIAVSSGDDAVRAGVGEAMPWTVFGECRGGLTGDPQLGSEGVGGVGGDQRAMGV